MIKRILKFWWIILKGCNPIEPRHDMTWKSVWNEAGPKPDSLADMRDLIEEAETIT